MGYHLIISALNLNRDNSLDIYWMNDKHRIIVFADKIKNTLHEAIKKSSKGKPTPSKAKASFKQHDAYQILQKFRLFTSEIIEEHIQEIKDPKLLAESDKNAAEVCDTLQGLKIENSEAKDSTENCDCLLTQFQMHLDKKDISSAATVRNKINVENLANDDECKYWKLSLNLFYSQCRYIDVAKSYLRMKDLLNAKEDKILALSNGLVALVLAQDSSDELHRILDKEKDLLGSSLPRLEQLLTLLTNNEVINLPLHTEITDKLNTFAFADKLTDKVIQHNKRIIKEKDQHTRDSYLKRFPIGPKKDRKIKPKQPSQPVLQNDGSNRHVNNFIQKIGDIKISKEDLNNIVVMLDE
eukprot:114265_1